MDMLTNEKNETLMMWVQGCLEDAQNADSSTIGDKKRMASFCMAAAILDELAYRAAKKFYAAE